MLLLSNVPDIRIYDTATWQRVGDLKGLPSGAVAYYPSADWRRGVVAFASGEVDLWNSIAGRRVSRLETEGELQSVSFSPDGSEVAVVSVLLHKNGSEVAHMRLWRVDTGRFVHELMPMEQVAIDGIGDPMWWRDSRHVMATTREGHSGPSVVGVWDAKEGRYRGGFSGCIFLDDPITQVLLQGGLLFKTCGADVFVWNAKTAIEQILTFEGSLQPQ